MNSFAGDIMTNSLSPQLLTPTDRQNRVEQLRNLVVDQVLASSADGILFSGGLDTSVLAAIAASLGRRLQAVMVSVAFFFSSRRRHTRLQGDWSSDVCSSD